MEVPSPAAAAPTAAAAAAASPEHHHHHHHRNPLSKIITVSSIAAGVQFGWALQLSLLTPYVQLLGVPHMWAAFIWLCGPISGLLVQPIVGYHSDRCTSSFGKRKPFIVGGAALVVISVFLIGFAADIGRAAGDLPQAVPKTRAVTIFVIGFWILDVANNMLQGPCRALLADISGHNHKRTRTANAFFSFFMAVGNVLGYAAGSYTELYKIMPFTKTVACDVYCANLKTCFIISAVMLVSVTTVAMSVVGEKMAPSSSSSEEEGDEREPSPCFGELFTAVKTLSRPMWILMLVTCMNWIAWFPFLLFDTDWMGKEVYGGDVKGSPPQVRLYDMGVRAGSLGLMLNAVILGLMSLGVEPVARVIGVKGLWGGVNVILAACLALTVWITKEAEAYRHVAGADASPPSGVKIGSLALFAALGIPQAITYSIPFALASIFSISSGAGQGLSLGVLNLAIVIPQMFVSVVSGPLDAAFGGGNLPAFVMGSVAALISGILAFTVLPSPPQQAKITTTAGGGH